MGAWNDAFGAALAGIRSAAAVAVVYTRAANREAIAVANAAVGKTTFKSDAGGEREAARVETRDYLLGRDALTGADGVFRPPLAGDQIAEAGRVHLASSIFGEPCWRWSDAGQTAVRVHTLNTADGTP